MSPSDVAFTLDTVRTELRHLLCRTEIEALDYAINYFEDMEDKDEQRQLIQSNTGCS